MKVAFPWDGNATLKFYRIQGRVTLLEFDSGLFLFLTADSLTTYEVSNGSGDEQGRKCTGYYTEEHCEYETADGITTEDEDAEQYEQC